MATTFYVSEVEDSAVALFKTLAMTPVICQKGDLQFWTENDTIDSDLLAIFVKATEVEAENVTLEGGDVTWHVTLRAIVVDDWQPGGDPEQTKRNHAKEVVDAVIDSTNFNLNGTIAGTTHFAAYPTGIVVDFEPPEELQLNDQQKRRVLAVAIDIPAQVRADR